MPSTQETRAALVELLYPSGIPRLVCPLLTHYRTDGSLDTDRISAHIAHMRPSVAGFLAPGSTGDGWEMDAPETEELLDLLVDQAEAQNFSLMIGVLRTEPGTVVPGIESFLRRYTGGSGAASDLKTRRITAFTVTPPKGSDLTQETIQAEIAAIAATGVPVAIYQLPQITENEMAPETVETLVSRYPNIYLLKDTSGADRVVLAKPELDNLYLVRGAEGDYAEWLKDNGGYYDGLLLSTANSFAADLGRTIRLVEEGRADEAKELSDRITAVVTAIFADAQHLPYGNPFANANKALDHHFAWGSKAQLQPPPMTHSGNALPRDLIDRAGALLSDYRFEIGPGYMN
ncbi:MAG: dihydrodipicolinate synthase family protein [Alkalispirochaeta sp.]